MRSKQRENQCCCINNKTISFSNISPNEPEGYLKLRVNIIRRVGQKEEGAICSRECNNRRRHSSVSRNRISAGIDCPNHSSCLSIEQRNFPSDTPNKKMRPGGGSKKKKIGLCYNPKTRETQSLCIFLLHRKGTNNLPLHVLCRPAAPPEELRAPVAAFLCSSNARSRLITCNARPTSALPAQ